jgi:hypothetical protein
MWVCAGGRNLCQWKWWTCCSHLSKLVLSFWGMGSSTEMALWVTPINRLLITCNYLQKKFWVSLKFFLKVLACVDNHSPSNSRCASRTWIWWQSGTCSFCFRVPWTYASEIPNLLAIRQMAILLQFWAWTPLLKLCFRLFCFLMFISIIWHLHGSLWL